MKLQQLYSTTTDDYVKHNNNNTTYWPIVRNIYWVSILEEDTKMWNVSNVVDFTMARIVAWGIWKVIVVITNLPLAHLVTLGLVIALMCILVKVAQDAFKR